MKKELIVLLFMFIVSLAMGQETTIDPGQQARDYLEGRNVSVDHTTGTFHYKVPLHDIKVGDFTLPISLDYVARGVRAEDRSGVVGYNWNMNTGGVVTRQLRGGIPDEIQNKGFAYFWPGGEIPSWEHLVYSKVTDGEADIFTAVFNGRSVSFVIRWEGGVYPYFFAEPLEPTDVRIICATSPPSTIVGWEITDEEGNKYVFQDAERCNTNRAGTVETNSLQDVSYVSSWYLSYIIPVNMPIIEYLYFHEESGNTWYGERIVDQSISSRTVVDYSYGRPVIDRPYDFSKYKARFDENIRLAHQYFSWENMDIYRRLQQNDLYNSMEDFYFNASLDEIFPQRIMSNLSTMGVLYDLRHVDQAYKGVVDLLDEMITVCNRQTTSYNTRMAVLHLDSARAVVTRCRNEVNEIWQKDVYQYGFQEVETPMLQKIKWAAGELEFEYKKDYYGSDVLNKVILYDMNLDTIRSIHLTRYSPGMLIQMYINDRQGEVVSCIQFDYYNLKFADNVVNIFGYYTEYIGDKTYDRYVKKHRMGHGWDDMIKHNSLKQVLMPGNGSIELDYEGNTSNILKNNDASDSHLIGAGIRLKKIKIKDWATGRADSIRYYYPRLGNYIYPELTNRLIINYPSGFHDVLYFDRLYNPGPDAIVKTGNNGIYYSHVVEVMEGKGRTEYYFAKPDTSNVTCNYRAIGNPLGVCYYNEQGRLRKAVRYEYDDTSALVTRKYLNQVKPCEYYVDQDKIERRYGDSLYFEDNLRPRLNPVLPANPVYQLDYDYGVYLKRVTEYSFEGEVPYTVGPDYLKESPYFTRTEYDYDLGRSTFPVKTTTCSGDGMEHVVIVKRAPDFDDDVDSSVGLLKKCNMVGVPLKVQNRVVEADGTERLLMEQVHEYVNIGTVSIPRLLLTGKSEYVHDGSAVEQTDGLYSFDRAMYDKLTISYGSGDGRYLPITEEMFGERNETRYDFRTGNAILRVPTVAENSVAARDYRRCKGVADRPDFQLLNAPSLKYKLCVLTEGSAARVVLSINYSGGTMTREFLTRGNHPGPQLFDLDLSAVAGITGVNLSSAKVGLVYIALVPADGEFEATSYNADGTVYCKFDHNGQAERYEYDAAGRVIKTYDQDGNLLKENDYNVVIR